MPTIVDACTKELLLWMLSASLVSDFVLETVQERIEKHKVSLHTETLIHSDRGVHYTSVKFIQLLKDNDLRQSMSRKANCWNNAPQESFFGHMEDEIELTGCETFDDIYRTISDCYNHDRYQWDLAKLSPCEYYWYLTTGIYPLSIPKPKGQA